MMIRRLDFACSGFALLLFASCSRKTPTLNLLVWEGYADPSFMRGFEEQYHSRFPLPTWDRAMNSWPSCGVAAQEITM